MRSGFDDDALADLVARTRDRLIGGGATEAEADERMAEVLAEAYTSAIPTMGAALLSGVRTYSPGMLAEHWRNERRFERRLRRQWRDPLDLYWEVLAYSREIGETFYEAHQADADDEDDYKFEALVSLHARACLTASEVYALLRTGHGSGAAARWRTLHELRVVTQLLARADTAVSEAYLLHEIVDHVKDLELHEQWARRHNEEGPDPAILEGYRRAQADLGQRFGPQFLRDWGWAASIIPPTDRVSFYALEKLADLTIERGWYRLASHKLHAGSKGTTLVVEHFRERDVRLVGPSNGQLEAAAVRSMISLASITLDLLAHGRPTIDGIMVPPSMHAFRSILDEAIASWAEGAHRLAAAEQEYLDAADRGQIAWRVLQCRRTVRDARAAAVRSGRRARAPRDRLRQHGETIHSRLLHPRRRRDRPTPDAS